MVIRRRQIDVGSSGNQAQAGGLEAVLHEQLLGGIEDARFGVGDIGFFCHGAGRIAADKLHFRQNSHVVISHKSLELLFCLLKSNR